MPLKLYSIGVECEAYSSGVMLIPPLAGLEILLYIHQGTYFVAPEVEIFACLDLEQNISFLDGHKLGANPKAIFRAAPIL
jgi:hypothetical protein